MWQQNATIVMLLGLAFWLAGCATLAVVIHQVAEWWRLRTAVLRDAGKLVRAVRLGKIGAYDAAAAVIEDLELVAELRGEH